MASRRERTATLAGLGTLALGVAPLFVSCSPPRSAESEKAARVPADEKPKGCACVATDEDDACDCPHCVGMNPGFEPGKCPCARRR